jgi:hypothetical protein
LAFDDRQNTSEESRLPDGEESQFAATRVSAY